MSMNLVKDSYTPDFGRPAEDPEFMLRLCLLQYLYGDSDREVEENARINLAYKYFLGLAVDEEPPDYSTSRSFRAQRLGEDKFREVFAEYRAAVQGEGTGQRQKTDHRFHSYHGRYGHHQPDRTDQALPPECAQDDRETEYSS